MLIFIRQHKIIAYDGPCVQSSSALLPGITHADFVLHIGEHGIVHFLKNRKTPDRYAISVERAFRAIERLYWDEYKYDMFNTTTDTTVVEAFMRSM